MFKQTAAVTIALVLSMGMVGYAFAQNQTQTQSATGLQIALVPEIQRGHQQHLTVYAVDDQGNQINDTEITSQITNERGQSVGPGLVTSNSGDTIDYKVGPNTRPQNITVFSYIEGQDTEAAQNYWVFPKGQAQVPSNDSITPVPEPAPVPENDTDTSVPEQDVNATAPSENGTETGPIVINPSTNDTQTPTNNTGVVNGTSGNQTGNQTNGGSTEQPQSNGNLNSTEVFENLDNHTAILDQAVADAEGDANATQRADIKTLIDGQSDAIGQTSGLTINATEDQLTTLEGGFAAGQDATNQVFDDGEDE